MTPDPTSSAAELASLYLTGAMTPEEIASFEARLDAGDLDVIAAVRDLGPVAEALLANVEPVTPPEHVRASLLHRAAASLAAQDHAPESAAEVEHVWDQWSPDDATAALFTIRAGEGSWDDTGVEGVQVRRLFVDRANDRMTALFRMAPGASYVPHVHDGPEECYVLDGDLHVGDDVVMRAGDYQRCAAGSTHGVQRTVGGCLLLISSSLHDEVIE
ncbi:MAG: cupin domain-containing protein [Phycisphaerales bacterium]|nr:cupin domain-containing protein [Phycisphaerales bacterium]